MYKDIAINWDVFQYKFTEKTRDVFEHLAYILFCHEFKIETGIFRYFNQPYVETLPVKIGEEYIGFQAKYYDAGTSISDKKTELKNAIEGAKIKYPEINKFLIYTNKELSTSSKKDTVKPEYQAEIEQYGLERDILVEWRVKSNFEIMLMKPELELIRDYFFNPDSGIKGYLAHVKLHSQNKLENIKSTISYRNQTFKIKKNNFDTNSFYESENPCLIIHGDGGSGKSGFAKDLLEREREATISFKATDFDVITFAEFSRKFGEYTFEDYLKLYNDEERKICLIDSTEKALIMNNRDTFNEFLKLLIKYDWKIIFTVRTVHKDNFINTFLHGTGYQELKIETLSKRELQSLLQDLDLLLPKEESYINLICNLFYLKLYIEIACGNNSNITTIEKFIESIWMYKIKNTNHFGELDVRREKTICNIVLSCANRGVYYYEYQLHDDSEAIAALKEDEIIFYDEIMRGYSLSHDIYEEIILKRIFENSYIKKGDCKSFFEEVGSSLIVRKTFRLWIKDKLVQETADIKNFLIEIFYSNEISSIWHDEILVTLMSIEDNKISLNLIDSILAKDEYKLLIRAVFLLNTTCKIINNDFWNEILTSKEQKTANLYRSTKPTGAGWGYIFNFMYGNLTTIEWNPQNIMLTIECLYNWTSYNVKGIETKHAGLIALYLYEQVKTEESLIYKLNDKKIEKINNVILSSAWEIDSELSLIVEEVISDASFNHMHKYYDLCKQALSNLFNCGNLADSNPKLIFALANKYWFLKKKNVFYSSPKSEDSFGINDSISHEYYPSSAFQTPIFRLLQSRPWETIDFIIDIFNKVTQDYCNSELFNKSDEILTIKIVLPDGEEIEQIASQRLWLMHRGTHTAPNLLESILMALERWLLLVLKDIPDVLEEICIKLLSSKSAALTSVVVSLVEAYPQKLFKIACILIPSKEVFILDGIRAARESSSNLLKGVVPNNKIYENERIRTNNQDFRKKMLEDVVLEYQLNIEKLSDELLEDRNKILYSQLDKVLEKIEKFEDIYQFAYYRMDIRKLKPDTTNAIEKNGDIYMPLVTELPKSLTEIQNQQGKEREKKLNGVDLYMWAKFRFEKNLSECEKYSDYENNPSLVFHKAKEILLMKDNHSLSLVKYAPIYIFVVLLRDFKEELSEKDAIYCLENILGYLKSNIGTFAMSQVGTGIDASIDVLPLIISKAQNDLILKESFALFLLLILDSNKLAIQAFSNELWNLNDMRALEVVCCYLELKSIYDSSVRIYNGISQIEFLNQHKKKIYSMLDSLCVVPNDFSTLNYYALLNLSMCLSPYHEETWDLSIEVGKVIWETLFKEKCKKSDDLERNIEVETKYIQWLAEYVMHIPVLEQKRLIKHLSPYVNNNKIFEWFLRDIIFIQDKVNKYDEFWNIWIQLQPIVISLCRQTEQRDRGGSSKEYYDDIDEIVRTYLFAFPWWGEKVKSWHSLKEENHLFFQHMSYEIGFKTSVLDSISKVLNSVGYNFLSQGIEWLYVILKNNSNLDHKSLEVNTVYYIEEFMQRYIKENRLLFKRTPSLRNKVITVLNFLVNRGSTVGFMLRESVV
ncbi:hypothetical protein COK34_28240 [Bacillus thuringiensis]|uniref:hypothetical protein n=1 Tax=Bacillus thuringiensis TaxID=1428 RepID=UPI000BF5E47A|nr:hypothetical protein [Bacillus thuringiensis]PFR48329.1 hypothetical protein COK34_28240 [Bacillus thuringiensis]